MSGQGQVSFRNIVKMHGEFAALKGVNFDINCLLYTSDAADE